MTPFNRAPLDDLFDSTVKRLFARKSAQIGWTEGVLGNALAWFIDVCPTSILVLFPKDGSAKQYNDERFEPMVIGTTRLHSKLSLKSRSADNKQHYKRFPGGFVKFVGSNSPDSVKSTSARKVFIEEPDDCNVDVKGQGDSITLAAERGKSFWDFQLIAGGTPTIKGLSWIDKAVSETSDDNHWNVPCHACGEAHALTWEQVSWDKTETDLHPVWGKHRPGTARYVCPACGVLWSEAEKNANVRRGQWVPRRPFEGTRGYSYNEMMSPFPGSTLKDMAQKWLIATREFKLGSPEKLIAFYNSQLGLAYEITSSVTSVEELKSRALDYEEGSVPLGGLVLTMGIDVQHDRLSVLIRAWGRGEESWLVSWHEIYGQIMNVTDPVWDELETIMKRGYPHASGGECHVSAVTLDCSDGQTSDATYQFVRRQHIKGRRIMAGKGDSTGAREVFSIPRKIEANRSGTKIAKYGLKIYIVGVDRAKDWILGYSENSGHINLKGNGPGRMHAYAGVRADYWEQVTAEVKAPKRGATGLTAARAWQLKVGRRNEALDCEVYALHAARSLKLDSWSDAQWTAVERELRQPTLLQAPKKEAVTPALPFSRISDALSASQPARTPAPMNDHWL